MAKARLRSAYPSLLALTVLSLSQSTTATLSLQDLQPIAEFPPQCQAAYQNPISACPDASVLASSDRQSSGSLCNKSCYAALKDAVDSIRQACQGTSAPPGTIIAHAFSGDLPYVICIGGDSGSSQSATNVMTSSYTSSSTSDGNDSASPTADSTSTSSTTLSSAAASTTSDSSSSSSSSSPSTSTSPSSTQSGQSSTLIGSSTETVTLSSSSTASKTTSKPSQSSLLPGGGGSPFDQTVPNIASPQTANHAAIPSMIGLAVLAVWAV